MRDSDAGVPGTSNRAQKETDRGAGANGAVTCGRAPKQAGQKDGPVEKERGQIGRGAAWARVKEPGRSGGGEAKATRRLGWERGGGAQPPGEAQTPIRQGCYIGRRATPRAQAVPVHSRLSLPGRSPPRARHCLEERFLLLLSAYVAKWYADTSYLATPGTVGGLSHPQTEAGWVREGKAALFLSPVWSLRETVTGRSWVKDYSVRWEFGDKFWSEVSHL